jgi:brefeldin A-resistance guanine nucleotide exchange factor 1
VPENLKNVLLFMASSGYLVPPNENPEHEKLWVETWKRIDRFLPDLRNELKTELPLDEHKPEEPSATSERGKGGDQKDKENAEDKGE